MWGDIISLYLPISPYISPYLPTGEATMWGSVAAELVRARNGAAMDEVERAAADGCER